MVISMALVLTLFMKSLINALENRKNKSGRRTWDLYQKRRDGGVGKKVSVDSTIKATQWHGFISLVKQ